MKKPRATAMTCLVLALGGLTTGCETAFLGEIIREGLVTGLTEEVTKIPDLILGAIFGDEDTEDDETM